MSFCVGIDIGGTFTDLVFSDDEGNIRCHKSPTTPSDYTIGIINCLRLASEDYKLDIKGFLSQLSHPIMHGSTISTNAMIEQKGAKVGIICTMGHSSILYRGDGNKVQDVFNYYIPYRKPLVPPHLCLEVRERINAEGVIEVPLDEDSVRAAVHRLKECSVEAIGVCLLWAIVNDAHERRIKEIVQEEWPGIPVTLGSEVQPIIREYYRTSCVAFDAMLKPVFSTYIKNLRETLNGYGYDKEIEMVVSTGGLMSSTEVATKPVYDLLSGPAMGPTAGLFFASQEGYNDCVVIDMGGTSFDISTVMDGKPTVTREAKFGEYPTGIASVDVLTLGAGGGSISWVDAGGLLHVGPTSAGAEPGPACYMKGGENPTVTDANVVLGYIDPDCFLGGRMKIVPELSRKAIKEKVAKPLDLTIEEAAEGIYRVVNENMVSGILDMTIRRGINPREFALVVGGGAAGTHALSLAKALGMRKIIIPKGGAVLCAMGMLNADLNFTYIGSKYTRLDTFDYDGINALLSRLEQRGREALDREGVPAENRSFEYYVAQRYEMQVRELDASLPESRITPNMIPQLIQRFHEAHKRRYAVSDPASAIECTDWRVVALGTRPKVQLKHQPYAGKDPSKALKSKRSAYFEEVDGFTETPVYVGNKLGHGMEINGPAIIEEPLTTVVLIPGCKAIVNAGGSYIVELS